VLRIRVVVQVLHPHFFILCYSDITVFITGKHIKINKIVSNEKEERSKVVSIDSFYEGTVTLKILVILIRPPF